MPGRKFTWANNLTVPTFEKLDRILKTEWEEKNPLSMVQALPRQISDHTPFFLNSGQNTPRGTQTLFKFEMGS
jgi:hypothetical protein